MKKILFISILFASISSINAQVAIGKSTVVNNSTILDFDNSISNTKGIILPAVDNTNNALPSNPLNNNGTFLFDKSDNMVKMYENNMWVNMNDGGSSSAIFSNNTEESSENQGVIIGANESEAKGVLVLESTNKAMVLPWIHHPHQNVKNPYPGMMCYDTASKTLAVYDGLNWNYWK